MVDKAELARKSIEELNTEGVKNKHAQLKYIS